ncbi:DUF2955 domain-containing protein [Halomonas sp. WWR20]
MGWLLRPLSGRVQTGPGLDTNGLRQCLRVAGGGALGFLISHLMNWNYGVFFTIFPMFLLAILPTINAHIVRQFLGGAAINCIEVSLVVGMLSHMPVIMTGVVFVLFYTRFALMARGPMFLFGANGVLSLSIMFHFASYPSVDLYDLLASNFVASLLAVVIALLMYRLFPDVAPRTPPARPPKSSRQIRHETLLGAIMATLSFLVFQVFDLRDSLSAQMATILILFALNYPGIRVSARKRIIGTLLGCNMGLIMQLLLFTYADNLLLVLIMYWIGLMLFARAHVLEGGASGIGFGGVSTLGILFGQYLSPNQDLVYSALYRFSSMAVALVVGLVVMAGVHALLNRFEATRSDLAAS